MKYFVRSLKYFVALCVLCVAIMMLNRWMGTAALSVEDTFYVMFHTWRGMMLPAVVVLVAAFYPRFGFMTRRVEGDVVGNRTQIMNAMAAAGFSLCREEDEVMYFRADGVVRKFFMLWDDEIRVEQYGQWIEVSGIRRGVANVVYRLEPYITASKR